MKKKPFNIFSKDNSSDTYIVKYFEDKVIKTIEVTGRGVNMAKKEFTKKTKLNKKFIHTIVSWSDKNKI